MHGLATLSIAALAGVANAWSYPDCEPDNCYRELTDSRFYQEAVDFCPGYLAGKTSMIPSDFENCDNDATKVSSACSCITYSATTSSASTVPTTSTMSTTSTTESTSTTPTSTWIPSTTSTSASVTSTPSSSVASTTSKPGYSHSYSQKMTTSTVTEVKTHTITSCAPEVTNCPGKPDHPFTTVETTVYTTVCPVTETATTSEKLTTSTVTEVKTHTITSCAATVTNCPGSPEHPHTTVETTVYTTVCPVTETATTPAGNGTWVPPPATLTTKKTLPGTITATPTGKASTTPSSIVTAGAARRGVEVAAAAAGVFAVMLL